MKHDVYTHKLTHIVIRTLRFTKILSVVYRAIAITFLVSPAEIVKPHRSKIVSQAIVVVISLQIHGPCWKY